MRHCKLILALGAALCLVSSCNSQDIERPGPTRQSSISKSKSSGKPTKSVNSNSSGDVSKVVGGADGSANSVIPDSSNTQDSSGQDTTIHEGDNGGTGTNGTGTVVSGNDGSNPVINTPEPTPAPIVYPSLGFTGGGYTTSQNKHVKTSMTLATFLDVSFLRLDTVAASIDCKPLGCSSSQQDDGNSKIQDRVVGNVDYIRPNATQLAQFKAAGFVDAPYAIFATKVRKTKPNGTLVSEVTFDKPLPVYPWPAPASRYDSLQGQATWSAHAVDNKGQSYTVIMTIKNKVIVGDYLAVTFEALIPEDGDSYRFYTDFPLPRTITFQMNSKTKDMCQILQMRTLFVDSSSKKQEMDMSYSIFAKRLNDASTPYECPPQQVQYPQ